MTRPYNFSAGPAAIPSEVLQQAAAEMLDWHGSGMGVMEMSHRGKEFLSIYEKAEADLRELLAVPSHFKILFMQGGGLAENAIVPLNLSRAGVVDFVVTGSWSQKSQKEARKYASEVNIVATGEETGYTTVPDPASWTVSRGASYLHLCSNETIHGTEFHQLPDLKALGSDAPLVIVREDLLGHALPACPSAFDYKIVSDNQSMYNTPPTWGIYVAGLTFQWLKRQTEGSLTGVAAMEQRNIAKATLLYNAIDQSQLYVNKVAANCRSRMNVPFFLRDESRNDAFLAGAKERGLLQLKGHKSVGGMRASIYNAMPLAGVQALVDYMREFEQKHA